MWNQCGKAICEVGRVGLAVAVLLIARLCFAQDIGVEPVNLIAMNDIIDFRNAASVYMALTAWSTSGLGAMFLKSMVDKNKAKKG